MLYTRARFPWSAVYDFIMGVLFYLKRREGWRRVLNWRSRMRDAKCAFHCGLWRERRAKLVCSSGGKFRASVSGVMKTKGQYFRKKLHIPKRYRSRTSDIDHESLFLCGSSKNALLHCCLWWKRPARLICYLEGKFRTFALALLE